MYQAKSTRCGVCFKKLEGCWISELAKLDGLWCIYWDVSRGEEKFRNLKGFYIKLIFLYNQLCVRHHATNKWFTFGIREVLTSDAIGMAASGLIPILPQLNAPWDTWFTVLLSCQLHVVYYLCTSYWYMDIWTSIVSNSLPYYFLMWLIRQLPYLFSSLSTVYTSW